MNRYILTLFILGFNLFVHAQSTKTIVDCQFPGWLSTRLNPTDIPTMVSLKVTGKINATDVALIGRLIKDYRLERVDLTDVDMVAEGKYEDGEFSGDMFGIKGDSLKYLALPRKLFKLNAGACWGIIDTLAIGSAEYSNIQGRDLAEKTYGTIYRYNTVYLSSSIMVKHLVVREGTKDIQLRTSDDTEFNPLIENEYLESVKLPNSMRTMGYIAFYRFINLKKINLPDSIEELRGRPFEHTKIKIDKDTVITPKAIRYLDLYAGLTNPYKGEGGRISTLYLSPSIDTLALTTGDFGDAIIDIHIKKRVPCIISDGSNRRIDKQFYKRTMQYCTVHVPVGAADLYRNTYPWSNATIREEAVPVTAIHLSDSIINFEKIGDTRSLVATIFPEDADNKNVTWTSTNPAVCVVAGNGQLFSSGYGSAFIIASSAQKGIIATCKINVLNTTLIKSTATSSSNEIEYYDLIGRKLSKPQRGINIIKKKGGPFKKVILN